MIGFGDAILCAKCRADLLPPLRRFLLDLRKKDFLDKRKGLLQQQSLFGYWDYTPE